MSGCRDKFPNFVPIFTIKVPSFKRTQKPKKWLKWSVLLSKTCIKHDLTNAQKEILAAENEIQICPSQLDHDL